MYRVNFYKIIVILPPLRSIVFSNTLLIILATKYKFMFIPSYYNNPVDELFPLLRSSKLVKYAAGVLPRRNLIL